MNHRWAFVLGAFVLAAWFAGCNSSFTRQRYETIYIGQPDWDVREVLGEPTLQEADTWTYIHTDTPYYRAVIYFRGGKVIGKDWSYEPPQETGTGDQGLETRDWGPQDAGQGYQDTQPAQPPFSI